MYPQLFHHPYRPLFLLKLQAACRPSFPPVFQRVYLRRRHRLFLVMYPLAILLRSHPLSHHLAQALSPLIRQLLSRRVLHLVFLRVFHLVRRHPYLQLHAQLVNLQCNLHHSRLVNPAQVHRLSRAVRHPLSLALNLQCSLLRNHHLNPPLDPLGSQLCVPLSHLLNLLHNRPYLHLRNLQASLVGNHQLCLPVERDQL